MAVQAGARSVMTLVRQRPLAWLSRVRAGSPNAVRPQRAMSDGAKAIRQPTEGRRFVDRSRIVVAGGKGGAGCVAFFRDPRTQWGGPDGGPGGDGGHVIIRASSRLVDLSRDRYTYIAGSGLNGKGGNLIGRAGRNVVVEVPVGTIVKVFPGMDGFLGPEALAAQPWRRAEHGKRNRAARMRDVDDALPDTKVSQKMQDDEANFNRKTGGAAGVRPSKLQRGKGAARQMAADDGDDARDDEPLEEGAGPDDDAAAAGGMASGQSGGLEVGSRVAVKRRVATPEYGWGQVARGSVGLVVGFDDDGDVLVDFPEQSGWVGLRQELACLSAPGMDQDEAAGDGAAPGGRGGSWGAAVDVTDVSIEQLWQRNGQEEGPLAPQSPPQDADGDAGRGQRADAVEVADLDQDGQEVTVAKGGRGGRGNTSFATKKLRAVLVHRAPCACPCLPTSGCRV